MEYPSNGELISMYYYLSNGEPIEFELEYSSERETKMKKSIESYDEEYLRGKKVLVRLDLNVPMDHNGNIKDDSRIRDVVPTIQYLIKNSACVILIAHLGNPFAKFTPKYSMRQLAPKLSELLGLHVRLVNDCIGDHVKKVVSTLRNKGVLLLENLRFHEGEISNDEDFTEGLTSLADLYVNEAFGTAHVTYGSTESLGDKLKPAVAGILMRKELDYLIEDLKHPNKPFVAIVGGATLSSNIDLIKSLFHKKVDVILLGGGLAFTFLKAQGYYVACSLVEMDQLDMAKAIISHACRIKVKLLFPLDGIMAKEHSDKAMTRVVPVNAISEDDWIGLDIGPETVNSFRGTLDTTETILWNGPMGVYEFDKFVNGTKSIAKKLAELTGKGVKTIIAGGNTVEAVKKFGLADKMSHVSTGRDASLELLMGHELPGLRCLDDA